MTELALNAAPFFAMLKPRLVALGAWLAQAIDAFAEARMRKALPARLLQKELEHPISKEGLPCSF